MIISLSLENISWFLTKFNAAILVINRVPIRWQIIRTVNTCFEDRYILFKCLFRYSSVYPFHGGKSVELFPARNFCVTSTRAGRIIFEVGNFVYFFEIKITRSCEWWKSIVLGLIFSTENLKYAWERKILLHLVEYNLLPFYVTSIETDSSLLKKDFKDSIVQY